MDEPDFNAQVPGGGLLTLNFRHPAGGFLYRATGPRLFIDGERVQVPGWGTHSFQVSQGPHRVLVWVPYVMPPKVGKAEADIQVVSGAEVSLEYMAPTITFARGSLGEPGAQKSAGFKPVMALNIAAVVFVVVAAIVVLVGR